MLIRCVCHTIHGAASYAASAMRADLEFHVRETRKWFAKSPLRRLQYRDLYAAIDEGRMPKVLVQLVRTRCLAWASAIEVVIEQWPELKQHFINYCLIPDPSEKDVMGRKLRDCFSEPHYLFLLFLRPITLELKRVNWLFQACDAEVSYS